MDAAAVCSFIAYYNQSPQSETPETAFHHMLTGEVNSLNKQEGNRRCKHNSVDMYTSVTVRLNPE